VAQTTNNSLITEIMTLKNAPLEAVKAKYAALYGQDSPSSSNKVFLWRKIAYRLQELEYGGLADETKSRINELIERYDPVNNTLRPKKNPGKEGKNGRDKRLPIPGAIIRKEYKDQLIEVKVLENGLEYQGKV
jgi:hypothetical protein